MGKNILGIGALLLTSCISPNHKGVELFEGHGQERRQAGVVYEVGNFLKSGRIDFVDKDSDGAPEMISEEDYGNRREINLKTYEGMSKRGLLDLAVSGNLPSPYDFKIIEYLPKEEERTYVDNPGDGVLDEVYSRMNGNTKRIFDRKKGIVSEQVERDYSRIIRRIKEAR